MRRSLFGLCNTPCATRYELSSGDRDEGEGERIERGGEAVALGGQRHHSCQAGAVETESIGRKPGNTARADAAQGGIEKRLDARVGGAQPAGEQNFLLVEIAQQRPGDFQELGIGKATAGGLAEGGKLQIDVAGQFFRRTKSA